MLKYRHLTYSNDNIMEKYMIDWILWTIDSDFSNEIANLISTVEIIVYGDGNIRVEVENINMHRVYHGRTTEFDLMDLSIFYKLGIRSHNKNIHFSGVQYVA